MIDSKRMQAVQSPVIPHVGRPHPRQPGHHFPRPRRGALPAAAAGHAGLARFGGAIVEHHYQAARGLPELREELRQKLACENQIEVGDDQLLMVTAGSNMGFYHALLAVADPGDEIVVMSPFYFNHEMAVGMANCRAVLVATDEAYQLDLDAIEAAITALTRAIVTISPNNPTGAVYRPADLAAVNRLCRVGASTTLPTRRTSTLLMV